jgi:hypothetical protein
LVAQAARERQVILLGEINRRSDLDGQIWTAESLVKLFPI